MSSLPHFFPTLLSWLSNPSLVQVGLEALRITSEEFMGKNGGGGAGGAGGAADADPAKAAITRELPGLLAAVFGSLEGVARECVPFANPSEGRVYGGFAATHPAQASLCVSAMGALEHLVSWVPIAGHVPDALYDLLFLFTWCADEVGVAALAAVNEILSRHCFPRAFQAFIVRVFEHQGRLLERLGDPSAIEEDGYVPKLTYFVEVFVTHHLRRVLLNPEVDMGRYLSLLFAYTFVHKGAEEFLACVGVWDTFLEFVVEKITEDPAAADTMRAIMAKFESGLVALLDALLPRTRFSRNREVLESLDDAERDEETGLTQLGAYMFTCGAVIEKLSTVYLEPAVGRILADLTATLGTYRTVVLALPGAAGSGGAGGAGGASGIAVPGSPHGPLSPSGFRLDAATDLALRDVPTALRLLGQLGPKLCARFDASYPTVVSLLSMVLDAADLAAGSLLSPSLLALSGPLAPAAQARGGPALLVGRGAEVIKSVFAVMHSFTQWLTVADGRFSASAGAEAPEVAALIARVLSLSTDLLSRASAGPAMSGPALSAATFLSSLVSSVRATCLYSLPQFEALVSNAHALARGCQSDAAFALYRAVGAALLHTGGGAGFAKFAEPVVAECLAAASSNNPAALPAAVAKLHAVAASSRGEKLQALQTAYAAVSPALQTILESLMAQGSPPALASEAAALFHFLIANMGSIMGPALVSSTLGVLVGMQSYDIFILSLFF